MADSITNSLLTADFVALEGDIVRRRQTMANITRPACDGQAYRYMGIKGEPYRLIGTRDTLNGTTAKDLIDAWSTFPTTMCSVQMRGVVHPYMLCHDFRIVQRKNCAGSVGGIEGGNYLLIVEFVFEDQAIS